MTNEKRKEAISVSYLRAICAKQGVAPTTRDGHDDDGIDVHLTKRLTATDGRWFDAQLNVQLKASSTGYREYDDYYSYPLKIKNYNDLRSLAAVQSYLFLLILPVDENEWVQHTIDELAIKRCMFWLDLTGYPPSENTSSVTVKIPKVNIVSPNTLEMLFNAQWHK